MSDRLFDIKKELSNGVDFGGGRGYLSKNILAETVRNLKIYDISDTVLEQASSTPGVNVEKHLLECEYLDVGYRMKDLENIRQAVTFFFFFYSFLLTVRM